MTTQIKLDVFKHRVNTCYSYAIHIVYKLSISSSDYRYGHDISYIDLPSSCIECNKSAKTIDDCCQVLSPVKVIHFSTLMSSQSSTWKMITQIKLDIFKHRVNTRYSYAIHIVYKLSISSSDYRCGADISYIDLPSSCIEWNKSAKTIDDCCQVLSPVKVIHFFTLMSSQSSTWKMTT